MPFNPSCEGSYRPPLTSVAAPRGRDGTGPQHPLPGRWGPHKFARANLWGPPTDAGPWVIAG
jgi:hypothetical protein